MGLSLVQSRYFTSTSDMKKLSALSPSLRVFLSGFLSVLVSASAFLGFLFVYAINGLLKIQPTERDLEPMTFRLHNVSQWESVVLPLSVSKTVSSWHCAVFDCLSAVPYLAHYALPVVYPLILLYTERRLDTIRQFYQLLGVAMWIHYAIWYILPTAPPWFYDNLAATAAETGPSAAAATDASSLHKPSVLREGAVFARLDQLTHVPFFHNMFAGNPVPFAAFPSGHVAWATVVMVTIPSERRWYFAGYVCLVAWATMYANHHYFADVIGAITVVAISRLLMTRFVTSERPPNPEKPLLGDEPDVCLTV